MMLCPAGNTLAVVKEKVTAAVLVLKATASLLARAIETCEICACSPGISVANATKKLKIALLCIFGTAVMFF